MYAIFVELHIKPGQMDAFLPLMQENATASKTTEPGCHQFDVVQSDADDNLILLYETYTDRAAFEAHMQTVHFAKVDQETADMVAEKIVHTGLLV
ncbi:MAG: putative quinol monooxygenase [Pseudomonadota bacterium]